MQSLIKFLVSHLLFHPRACGENNNNKKKLIQDLFLSSVFRTLFFLHLTFLIWHWFSICFQSRRLLSPINFNNLHKRPSIFCTQNTQVKKKACTVAKSEQVIHRKLFNTFLDACLESKAGAVYAISQKKKKNVWDIEKLYLYFAFFMYILQVFTSSIEIFIWNLIAFIFLVDDK